LAGREFDEGTSELAIVSGTGQYTGISGQMESVNNGDGTYTNFALLDYIGTGDYLLAMISALITI